MHSHIDSTFVAHILLLFILVATSCEKHEHGGDNHLYLDQVTCSSDAPKYDDLKSIFSTHCSTSGCHNAASAQHDVILDTKADVVQAFEEHSVMCAINHGEGCEPMPLNGTKLSDADIELISCWAKGGYQ